MLLYLHFHRRAGSHLSAFRISCLVLFINISLHACLHTLPRIIFQLEGHIHHCFISRDLFVTDKGSPLCHMYRRRFHQPYIPVDSRSRIPPGSIVRIIQTDSQCIFLSGFHIRSQIKTVRSITIRPSADKLPITPDRRVRHRPIYIQINLFSGIFGAQLKGFTIPAYSPIRQFSGSSYIIYIERPFNSPVMRKVQLSPATIVKIRFHVSHLASRVSCRTNMFLPRFDKIIGTRQ